MAAKDFYVCEYTEGGWLEKRLSINFAEDEGFKPPIPKKGIPDFESSAFGHSANLPLSHAKVMNNSYLTKNK